MQSKNDTPAPVGIDSLVIPGGQYERFIAKGIMSNCVSDTWKEIWNSDISRAYRADFEVYDERSKDWDNSKVDIFVSVK